MPSIGDAFGMIGKMLTNLGVPSLSDFGMKATIMSVIGLFILIFKDLRDEFFRNKFLFLDKKAIRWVVYVVLFCMILNFGVLDGGQFIYVSF